MSESMNPGSENSQVVNMVKALIQQSVNNEAAIRESIQLTHAHGTKIGVLEESTAAVRSEIGEIKGKVATIDNSVRQVAQQKFLSPDQAASLHAALRNHAELFNKPLEKSVRHTHFLGWSIWILVTFFVVIVILGICLYHSWDTGQKYQENDIKWRSMKLSRNQVLLDGTQAADSSYRANPDVFRSDVEFEENRREKYNAKLWQKARTEQEMEDLQRQEKKR
jgi:hypothetical protein